MSKKVIEQIKVVKYFGKGEKEPTVIDNPSAIELTTVAKAICPEYQKVIDQNVNLQSDLSAWENRAKEAEQRNAKLVEALEKVKDMLESPKLIDGRVLRHIVNQALHNTKKIEGL